MKKSHEKRHMQGSSPVANPETETLRHVVERTSSAKKRRTSRHDSVVVYEEGDLRGIVVKALAESTDPYLALLEAGDIKSASEFFDGSDKVVSL